MNQRPSHTTIKPELILDEAKCRNNIRLMKQRADDAGVIFRPHFKTHQSAVVGQWFRQAGVHAITVSSVTMAEYFASHGWDDITIAFPVNLLEMNAITKLASRINLNLLVESAEVTAQLGEAGLKAGVFIKIDVGAHRTGIPVHETEKILNLINTIRQIPSLTLKGFLAHAGHTYKAKGYHEINQIAMDAANALKAIRLSAAIPDLLISWGDTPSCSLMTENPGFDEWRPGNFVFYDVMQYHIGSCSLDQIAVAMACPVVATHSSRNQVVIYGGAIHFSKERIMADDNFELFGYVVEMGENGWGQPIPGAWLSSLSQEHGIVTLPETVAGRIKPGMILGILPIHSCLAVSALKEMYTLNRFRITCMPL